jgi:putative FmdB family regulatory protein
MVPIIVPYAWQSDVASANRPAPSEEGRRPVPTYQYKCTECGHAFEQFQSFSDDALEHCPECQGRLRKVFNAVGVVFKGSGFYRTDSRSSASSGSGSGSGDSGSSGAGSGSGDAGSSSGGAGSSGSSGTSSSGGASTSGGSSSSPAKASTAAS